MLEIAVGIIVAAAVARAVWIVVTWPFGELER